MSIDIALKPIDSTETVDARLQAFLLPGCRDIFRSIATPIEIWRADRFDVESIHEPARSEFERLLTISSRTPAPSSGAILVLLGEAGSGKTHLMRAFRTSAHSQGAGERVFARLRRG